METENKKIWKKMKVYSKTVIDWLLGQQQYCLTREQNCCQTKLLLSSDPVNDCIILHSNHTHCKHNKLAYSLFKSQIDLYAQQ